MAKQLSTSGTLHVNRPGEVVSFQAKLEEDGAAGYYTVQFGVSNPKGGAVAARAVVSWSVDGNTIRRVCDVGNGLSISGAGQAVRVQVEDNSSFSFADGQPYTVTILVVKGTRPNPQVPVTYRVDLPDDPGPPIDTVEGTLGGSHTSDGNAVTDISDFPVPEDAGAIAVRVYVTKHDGTSDAPKCLVQQLPDENPSEVLKSYNPVLYNGFVELSPGTRYVRVKNLEGGSQPLLVAVVFAIEG